VKPTVRIVLAFAAVAAVSCTRPAASPGDEIRALLARAETAVRERDAGAVKALIADDYADDEGRDKRMLAGLAAHQFVREGSLHVATRLASVSFPASDRARAGVIAAMGRTAIDWKSLPDIDGEVYRFDLELRRGDQGWQVTRAAWKPATVADL
jgi:hypothetical protein